MADGKQSSTHRQRSSNTASLAVAAVLLVAFGIPAAAADDAADFSKLSLEDLTKVEVSISSVSRRAEALSDAPAAVYVITHDDIIRSGAEHIPEMLRLAPNLQVAQINASSYAISARGFNNALADKLLVLIDGRTVYSPLFAGMYWDMQEVLPENIDRIEVISGPGATLWGANAVNGVINIITRKSSDTQGGVVAGGVGNIERGGMVQYGGRVNDDLTYRLYGTGFVRTNDKLSNGLTASDGWNSQQGGFRIDWSPPGDLVTLQGDYQTGGERQQGTGDLFFTGSNLLGRWTRQLDGGGTFQVQAYFDQVRRFTDNGGGGFLQNTYNIDMQHSFKLGDSQEIVWGAGERVSAYDLTNTATFGTNPASRNLNLADIFIQDTIHLIDRVNLTLGMKVEKDPYVAVEPLPSVRLSWKPVDNLLLWSAVSRAIRAPTPLDRDIFEKVGTVTVLQGGPNFTSEKLIAYELGTRIEPTSRISLSISGFYNTYDELRSIEFASSIPAFPLQFGNMMVGDSYGTEFWASYKVLDWWRLAAGFNWLHENLHVKSGSSGIGGIAQAGDDPHHQLSLRSSVDLPHDLTLDTDLRGVAALPNPPVPSYYELNARLGWKVTDRLTVSLTGNNLLHAHHVEFASSAATPAVEIPRSVYLRAQWRF